VTAKSHKDIWEEKKKEPSFNPECYLVLAYPVAARTSGGREREMKVAISRLKTGR